MKQILSMEGQGIENIKEAINSAVHSRDVYILFVERTEPYELHEIIDNHGKYIA